MAAAKKVKAAKPKELTAEERIAQLEEQVSDLMDLLHEHGIRHKVHTDEPDDDADEGDDAEQE